MIASRLSALGLSDRTIRALLVLTFGLVAGILAATIPHSPLLPPVELFLAGLAALVDPNAHTIAPGPIPVPAVPAAPVDPNAASVTPPPAP